MISSIFCRFVFCCDVISAIGKWNFFCFFYFIHLLPSNKQEVKLQLMTSHALEVVLVEQWSNQQLLFHFKSSENLMTSQRMFPNWLRFDREVFKLFISGHVFRKSQSSRQNRLSGRLSFRGPYSKRPKRPKHLFMTSLDFRRLFDQSQLSIDACNQMWRHWSVYVIMEFMEWRH